MHIFYAVYSNNEVWREIVKVVINEIEEERKEYKEARKKIMAAIRKNSGPRNLKIKFRGQKTRIFTSPIIYD